MNRITCFFVLALIAAVCTHAPSAQGAQYDLYVLSGQSNLNTFRYLQSGTVDPALSSQDDVQFQYWDMVTNEKSTDWTTLYPVGGFTGTELSFGRAIADNTTGSEVAIVKPWRAGANLATQFNPDSTDFTYYNDVIDFTLSTKAQLEGQGHTVNIAGFAWVQGESDAFNEAMANAYAANLTNFIEHLRADLGVADLPFVFSQIHPDIDGPYVDIVRAQQALAASSISGVTMIDASDLTIRTTDQIHYVNTSKIELGYRLGNAMVPEPSSLIVAMGPLLTVLLRRRRGR